MPIKNLFNTSIGKLESIMKDNTSANQFLQDIMIFYTVYIYIHFL